MSSEERVHPTLNAMEREMIVIETELITLSRFFKPTTESHNKILISINTFIQLKDKNDKYCYYNLRNQAKLRIV